LDRLSRLDVEKLLGEPTNTRKFKEYDLVYWLGPERGLMHIDSEWLVVRFDEKGVLLSYAIVRD
jgi:hypothetical protein